jgi:hypothetical protein
MPYAALNPECEVLNNPDLGDLERVAATSGLPGLIIFGYPFETLEQLSVLSRLQILKIQGAPKLRGLQGTEYLSGLREFVLSTPTGSDGSRKFIGIGSLAPLERLSNLERLILLHVRPKDLDLSPVMRMQHLVELDIGGVPEFTLEHYAKLALALPKTKGRCLQPFISIPGVGRCGKCQGPCVLLNGTAPRARKWVCPKCNAKLLGAHIARWEELTGQPYAVPS